MNPEITAGSQIFYCVLSAAVLLLAIAADRTGRGGFAAAIVLLLTFVAGLRAFSVGRDTGNYIIMFEQAKAGGPFEKEPGFMYLCRGLLALWDNYTFLLALFSLLIYGLILFRFWEMRDTVSFGCAVFAFYAFYFFESMNVMRQFCAVAVIFWATRYLRRRKYLAFGAAVLAATAFFHKSAVLGFLYFPVELFSWKELSRRQKGQLIALLSAGLALGAALFPRLLGYLDRYRYLFENFRVALGLRVPALLGIFAVSLFLVRQPAAEALPEGQEPPKLQGPAYFVRNARIYYVLGCAMTSLDYFFEFVGRTGYYFIPWVFAYFGLLARAEDKRARWALRAMVCGVTAYVLFGYLFTHNGAWHHPYLFVWEQ